MKIVFPYDPRKYAAGLILAVILGVFLLVILSLIDSSPMSRPRLRDNIEFYVVIIVPLLTICSLVRHYWLPMVIFVSINVAYGIFVMLNWMPYPANMSVWSKLWIVMFTNVKMILIYVIEGVFFQQYCKRVCCLPKNKLGGLI